MKVLIIGSEGFIGRTAAAYFESNGYDVYCVDVIDKPGAKYYRISPQHLDFATLFNQFNSLDVCINASGAANVQASFKDTLQDFQLNTHNVMLIAEAIRRIQPACKLINLSSAAVYGNPKVLPVVEEASPAPQSPYGWHKLLSEQICREYAEQFGVNTLSLRLFSAYGEGQKKLLFWDIYQKVLNAKDGAIEMFGTGNETRDFIYIGDVMQALECAVKEATCNGQTINVASGLSTSIADAVKTFLNEAAMAHINPRFLGNNKEGDPLYWQADIRKLEQLGFVQRVPLNLGLKSTIAWMKNQS